MAADTRGWEDGDGDLPMALDRGFECYEQIEISGQRRSAWWVSAGETPTPTSDSHVCRVTVGAESPSDVAALPMLHGGQDVPVASVGPTSSSFALRPIKPRAQRASSASSGMIFPQRTAGPG